MDIKRMFALNTVIAALFGFAFLAIPEPLTRLYGVQLTDELAYVARLFGAALLTLAALTWSARGITQAAARRSIAVALFVGDAAGLVAAILGQAAGVLNAFGWSSVAIYVVLTLGYGYFLFVEDGPESLTAAVR